MGTSLLGERSESGTGGRGDDTHVLPTWQPSSGFHTAITWVSQRGPMGCSLPRLFATMPGMSDRKKKPDAHKGTQIPFRADDPRLVEALEAYAKKVRRSRNMAIILLLETALKAEGLWPPPQQE